MTYAERMQSDGPIPEVNQSLDDVVALLEREIRRLTVSLENRRLSLHADRETQVLWHVRAIEERRAALVRVEHIRERQKAAASQASAAATSGPRSTPLRRS